MKRTLLIVCLTAIVSFAQNVKFALLSDVRIGAPKADSLLTAFVDFVNEQKDFNFVIIDGNITNRGLDSEFEKAKSTLDKLHVPYYLLQGYRDVQWAQSAGVAFTDLWDETNFSFNYGDLQFVGINTTPIWHSERGHLSPSTLQWLEKELSGIDTTQNVILFSFNPLNNIDNWFKLTNAWKGNNIGAFLSGASQKPCSSMLSELPPLESVSFYDSTNYHFLNCELKNDTLSFTEMTGGDTVSMAGNVGLRKTAFRETVDSVQFNPFAVKPIWRKELNATLISKPLVLKDKIIVAQYDGLVTCFDKEGNKLWDFDSFGNIASTPAAKDGWLTVATLQGDLFTLDLKTGNQIQSIGFDEAITSSLLMIDYKGTKELMIPKQSNSKAAVVFGTESGKLYCYDVETLQEYWENKSAKGMIQTTPLYVNDKLIYSSWDSYLYCADAREGWLIWKWRMNKNFYNSPAAVTPVTDGHFLFLPTPEGNIYKVDLLLGKTIWTRSKYNAWESIGISEDGKTLYVKSAEDYFHKIPASTGTWSIAYKLMFGEDKTPTTPLEYNKIILLTTANGNVYRIKGKKHKVILFNGNASPFSVTHFYDDVFISSNIDGTITVFRYDGN